MSFTGMGLWEESNRDEWGFEERDEEMDEGANFEEEKKKPSKFKLFHSTSS